MVSGRKRPATLVRCARPEPQQPQTQSRAPPPPKSQAPPPPPSSHPRPPRYAKPRDQLSDSSDAVALAGLTVLSQLWGDEILLSWRQRRPIPFSAIPWKKQSMPHSFNRFACATTKCMDTEKKGNHVTDAVRDNNPTADLDIWFPDIIEDSSHRDGAIYHNKAFESNWFDVDITDRNETLLEPMMFSEASEICLRFEERCMHYPTHMLQFFSMTLAECFMSNGPIQLYGYIATRDDRDCMLNYILNHSRDDPIIIQQGSLIEMTGPKRAIELVSPVLIEFDMRIKNGEQEDDDLELIDGVFACTERSTFRPIKHRVSGNCGSVDMSLALIEHAVEATIEVVISEVHKDFSLSLSSYIYLMGDFEEIQLSHSTIDHPCGFRRFVVAVTWGTEMLLKLKFRFDGKNIERYCCFKAKLHGSAWRQIKMDFASVSVTTTWSTI
ncbi:hypothetical protein ACP4OV_010161 [Aristida adscensionis]